VKKAAEGLTSDKSLLPPFLKKPLLTNLSAVKRAHNDTLQNEWIATWCQSERGGKMLKIDNSTLSKKFLRAISALEITRSSASLISQLRLTHILLNSYLKWFKRTDSARCPACGADEKTISHFLLLCPSYAHERWALARQAKKNKKGMSLVTLLGDPRMVIPLANYIDATHRFTIHSEQTTN
jgi:hypothetical protein